MAGGTILVIEDDEAIRESFKLALEFQGYRVLEATDGRNGLEVLRSAPRPCLILVDLMMPVMNGREFIEALRKNEDYRNIPVVVVTAFQEKAKTKAIDAEEVIAKPVSLDELSSAVSRWCD